MDVEIWQIISSATLATASILVASFAAYWSYRNNFGYAPSAFISGNELEVDEDFEETKRYEVALWFELWNRRRYPIFVRTMTLTFEDIELLPPDNQQVNAPWRTLGRHVQLSYDETLDASKHYAHTLTIPFTTPSQRTLRDVAVLIHIKIEFFDPRLNKSITLDNQHKYYPVKRGR